MSHEVAGSSEDEQDDSTPKQQADNRPVVWLALSFFHVGFVYVV
jgi:hypothetical protein